MNEWVIVVMQSEDYGRETFKYGTFDAALAGIERLYERTRGDGVERVIGILVNAEDEEES